MALDNNTIGKKGEQLAASWLGEQGFDLLFRNWRTGRLETDIVAYKAGIVYCIEVKTRRNHRFGWPEDKVSRRKRQNMRFAAERFLEQHEQFYKVQLVVLSIVMQQGMADIQFMEIY